METADHEITLLLDAATRGDQSAWEILIPRVYAELRALAESQMNREWANHTLQPTALVHEAFIRLTGQRAPRWNNRHHFFGAAAQVMRRVLVDFARARKSEKRGGNHSPHTELDLTLIEAQEAPADVLAVDDALCRLAKLSAEQERVVELRYFGGLTIDQTAAVMGISAASVDRLWRVARAWLLRELGDR